MRWFLVRQVGSAAFDHTAQHLGETSHLAPQSLQLGLLFENDRVELIELTLLESKLFFEGGVHENQPMFPAVSPQGLRFAG